MGVCSAACGRFPGHAAQGVEDFEFPAQGYKQIHPGKQRRQTFISTRAGAIPEFAGSRIDSGEAG